MSRVVWVWVLFGMAACSGEATAPPATETAANLQADNILYEFKHNMTTDGVRKALLAGDSAYVRQNDSRVDVVGVRLTFFNDNGTVSGDLSARTGEYDLRSGTMIARGDAVLNTVGTPSRRVESDELQFDLKGDRIWSDKATVMREGASVLRGSSFRSDTKFRNLTVGNATTTGPAPRGLVGGSAESNSGGIRF